MFPAPASYSNKKASCEELQSELDFYKNLEKSNAQIIEGLKNVIQGRDAKTKLLEQDNKDLERRLRNCKEMSVLQFSKDLQLFHNIHSQSEAIEQELKRTTINQATEIENLRQLLEISFEKEKMLNESWQDKLKMHENLLPQNKKLREKCDQQEKELKSVKKSNNDQLYSLRLKFKRETDILENTTRNLNVMLNTVNGTVAELRQQISGLENEIRLHSSMRYTKLQGVENFPKALLDTFSKLKTKQNTVTSIDDEIFHKEFAKRMTCQICVSDIERLRCSQCLNGICRGCHSKVENCPHCRNGKQNFEPVIIPRI